MFPPPEAAPFPLQTFLYAAPKLAGEGTISAYAHGFAFTGVMVRFASILGEHYTHGHVYDFYRSLKRDPSRLRVLGDGRQEKSYLYIVDCERDPDCCRRARGAARVRRLKPGDRRDGDGRRLDRGDL